MPAHRIVSLLAAVLFAGGVTFAQVGRGWSDWPTPYADAQRTSWLRTDPNISVESLSKPGFELQWTSKLDELRPRVPGPHAGSNRQRRHALRAGSLVAGANSLYMLDNDTGHIVWSRTFEQRCRRNGRLQWRHHRSADAHCERGAEPTSAAAARGASGRAQSAGLSQLARRAWPRDSRRGSRRRGRPAGAPGAAARPGACPAQAAHRVAPGATDSRAPECQSAAASDERWSVTLVAADGQLHVVGLQSGKDLQKPAPFLPPNSQWSNPVAVGTMMYAATSGNCAGAPNGVYAIDLDAPDKPVVSYRTNGGSVVGAVAFSSDGNTLLAAIGPGTVKGDGKANAIVALDPNTLQLKDWFTQPTAEFVTGPTVFRHGTKDVVAAATKDGRVILLDAASLGGTQTMHTPLLASPPFLRAAARSRQRLCRPGRASRRNCSGARESAARWILVPISGRPSGARTTNGAIRNGAVVALRVRRPTARSRSSRMDVQRFASPATPIIVNGVVFALSTGRRRRPAGRIASGALRL